MPTPEEKESGLIKLIYDKTHPARQIKESSMKSVTWTCDSCGYTNQVTVEDIDEADSEIKFDVHMHRDDHDMIEANKIPSNPTDGQLTIQSWLSKMS